MNRIQIKGSNGRYEEALAAGNITGGHLIKNDANGKYAVHASEGGIAEKIVAIEDGLQGSNKSTVYATGATVFAYYPQPGDVLNMFLAAGENVTKGVTFLCSTGDGSLKAVGNVATAVTDPKEIFVADETLNLTASGAVATLIRVRAL